MPVGLQDSEKEKIRSSVVNKTDICLTASSFNDAVAAILKMILFIVARTSRNKSIILS